MNKSELIASIAAKADIEKSAATKCLNALLECVTAELKEDREVVLVGFGTFSVKERAARAGRDPRTGNAIQIPAAKVPGFKPGKGLKDSVN